MRQPIRSPYPLKKKVQAPALSRSVALDFTDLASLAQSLEAVKKRMEDATARADARTAAAQDAIEGSKKLQAAHAERVVNQVMTIQKGERGLPGKDAEVDYEQVIQEALKRIPTPHDGETPEIDYEKVIREAAGRIHIRDGKDAEIDYEKLTDMALEALKEKLTIDHIPGLKNELDGFSRQVAGKIYGKDTWARGGGDTVEQGTGITITSTKDGKKRISSSGGGGGLTFETPTGAVNAVNTVFTPTKEPVFVIADGITYFEGAGYAWDGTNITMDVPPSQYIRDAITS